MYGAGGIHQLGNLWAIFCVTKEGWMRGRGLVTSSVIDVGSQKTKRGLGSP